MRRIKALGLPFVFILVGVAIWITAAVVSVDDDEADTGTTQEETSEDAPGAY